MPRVLHFNDCADVSLNLVTAASEQGLTWRRLGPCQVRPPVGAGRLAWLPRVGRTMIEAARAEVIHVHYATSVPLIQRRGIPRRPYLLHLHGSDIRSQWTDPAWKPAIQQAIDGAERVYYTNLDTVEQAETARPDAEYMPAFVDFARIAPRTLPADGTARVVRFASRWSSVKNAPAMLQTAAHLARLGIQMEGLDWGDRAAEAAEIGVRLVPTMPGPEYSAWLAGASAVVGQGSGLLGVSEIEALAAGVPLVMPGTELYRYPDGSLPPVLHGEPEEAAAAIAQIVEDGEDPDPVAQIGWVRAHHTAWPYVPVLQRTYEAAAGA